MKGLLGVLDGIRTHLLLTCCFVACLCFSQNAKAQYVHQIQRDHDSFVTQDGKALTDAELVDLIGEGIFSETVVSARKQYNAGKWLIVGGSIGLFTGGLAGLGGVAILSLKPNNESDLDHDWNRQNAIGRALLYGGLSVYILGGLSLSMGIPLRLIGINRLNWVEENYNKQQSLTCSFGPTANGLGLSLIF